MILVQIATALAIGAYVVLSKDAQPKRPDASPRESFQQPADRPIISLIATVTASLRRFMITFSSPMVSVQEVGELGVGATHCDLDHAAP
jgi:hypothetical protein